MPKPVARGITKLKTLRFKIASSGTYDQNWRKLDEMCYRKLMDTELLKQSWKKLTQRGYTLNSPAPEVVNIITPTGYSTQIRLKRLPSYARYVR